MTPERFARILDAYFDDAMPAPRDDTPLTSLGLDSLDLVEIVMEIENINRSSISDSALEACRTYGDLKKLAVAAPPSDTQQTLKVTP